MLRWMMIVAASFSFLGTCSSGFAQEDATHAAAQPDSGISAIEEKDRALEAAIAARTAALEPLNKQIDGIRTSMQEAGVSDKDRQALATKLMEASNQRARADKEHSQRVADLAVALALAQDDYILSQMKVAKEVTPQWIRQESIPSPMLQARLQELRMEVRAAAEKQFGRIPATDVPGAPSNPKPSAPAKGGQARVAVNPSRAAKPTPFLRTGNPTDREIAVLLTRRVLAWDAQRATNVNGLPIAPDAAESGVSVTRNPPPGALPPPPGVPALPGAPDQPTVKRTPEQAQAESQLVVDTAKKWMQAWAGEGGNWKDYTTAKYAQLIDKCSALGMHDQNPPLGIIEWKPRKWQEHQEGQYYTVAFYVKWSTLQGEPREKMLSAHVEKQQDGSWKVCLVQ